MQLVIGRCENEREVHMGRLRNFSIPFKQENQRKSVRKVGLVSQDHWIRCTTKRGETQKVIFMPNEATVQTFQPVLCLVIDLTCPDGYV